MPAQALKSWPQMRSMARAGNVLRCKGEQGVATATPAFSVQRTDHEDGHAVLAYSGPLTFTDAVAFVRDSRELLRAPATQVRFDLADVEVIDTATLALLLQLVRETEQTAPARIVGAQGRTREVLDLYSGAECRDCLRPPPARQGLFTQIGNATWDLLRSLQSSLDYLGHCVLAASAGLRRPSTVNWPDVVRLSERAGADGFPIVFLISILIGLIMAFQGAVQLKQFGADIFVADLVALTITRELGPLMTAIIVAGRSGAAFAAELGTMKVSEEIDALRTLGLCPYRFLVFPRLLALVIVLPLLTLMSDLVGILGGLLTSLAILDLTPRAYVLETQKAMALWDVWSGIVKSVFFAGVIALISCERGLGTKGGASGVGASTTSAVVTCLFMLVLMDAAFTILFNAFGV
jgi:phospholipid/cholesterol/gamma-HCH transport system permease protein